MAVAAACTGGGGLVEGGGLILTTLLPTLPVGTTDRMGALTSVTAVTGALTAEVKRGVEVWVIVDAVVSTLPSIQPSSALEQVNQQQWRRIMLALAAFEFGAILLR